MLRHPAHPAEVRHTPPRTLVQARQPTASDLCAAPPMLIELATRQCGVVSRVQLALAGISRARLANELAARRWRAIGRYAVVLHNGPLTGEARFWAAVLLPGKPAALAGATASAVGGLTGFESERVHLVVAHGTEVRAPSWIKLHESRRFDVADVVRGGRPPRTRLPRSVVDAAAWSTSPRRACALLCAAVQQRLTTAAALESELAVAGRVRHVAVMRAIAGDIAGGGHTLTEIDFGRLARRAGFERVRRQVLRPEPGGRIRYIDIELDLPDGVALAVEIDGAAHLKPLLWWDDMSRQNEQVIGGRPMLRFSSAVVRLDGPHVIDQLRRMRQAHAR